MKTKITLLLLAFFMFVSNAYSQNTFDGSYCPGPGVSGDEYLGQLTTGALSSSGGTCEIGQIWAKVDNLGQSLRLAFKIGNAGTALIRIYIDKDNNSSTGLITDSSFGGTPAAGGAEYILQINTNTGATKLFKDLTSTTVTEVALVPGGLSGKNGDSNGCAGGDKVFVEFYIPFASIGFDPCNTTQPGTINVARYASVSGGSTNSSGCTSQQLNFGVPLSGSVTPNQSLCQGTSASQLTLTINGGINTTVQSWQDSTDGVTFTDIAGTSGLYIYAPGLLSVGNHYYRARILNTGICVNSFFSSAAKITVNAAPNAPTTTLTQPPCSGGTGTITITSPIQTGMTYSINGLTYTNTTGIFTSILAGTYSVTAKSATGCISPPSSVIITAGDNTPPVIAILPTPSTINCPATPVFAIATATDNSGTVSSLTFADVTTSGTCAGSYSVTRTWTAKDACNNSSTASQTINVQDITAPVIAALPATSTINCPATPVF
ncbi:hypothetical protein, partial [Flavobacterium soyangense]